MEAIQTALNHARARWEAVQPLELPPPVDVVLWQHGAGTIYLSGSLGPAVPYGPVPRTDGHSNYGYRKLKGNLAALPAIPELLEWPEYAGLVRAVNEDSCCVESVGCDVRFFPVEDPPTIKVQIASYVDLVFSDPNRAQDLESQFLLAAKFIGGLDGSEHWLSSVGAGIQRLRHFPGTTAPLGVRLRLASHGRTEREARKYFAASLARAIEVAGKL